MSADRPTRVAIARPAGAAVAWHDAVEAAVRSLDAVAIAGPDGAIDLLIDLGGAAATVDPPLGVWRYGFGDGTPVANGAAGTWVRLYRTTADPDRAIVLHEGWYRARTRDGWGTKSVGDRVAPWCARVLRQIQLGDCGCVRADPQSTAGCRDREPPASSSAVARTTLDAIDTVRGWFTRQRWTIGIVPVALGEVLQRGRLPETRWITGQPTDRFYADPFPLARAGGVLQILAEEYVYRSGEKRIALLEIDEAAALRRVVPAAGLPPHASYPFLLRAGGAEYCLPEAHRSRRVSAFRREAESAEWRHACDLIGGFPPVDATLLEHDGTWWLFCTKQGEEDQTELHLFMAPSWDGPWTAHPLNPVKSDTRSSRPAGACFTIDGAVCRPAQNCARRYGAGITINRIVELSARAFREDPVLMLFPPETSPWPHGLHTINGLGDVTVVDGLRVTKSEV